MIQTLLNTKQVSDILGINSKSLANSRCNGSKINIPYIKIGNSVRYKQSDLDHYIQDNTFNHTGESKWIALKKI